MKSRMCLGRFGAPQQTTWEPVRHAETGFFLNPAEPFEAMPGPYVRAAICVNN
ncbi:hypothetical protein OFEAOIEE_LOCUS2011 [Methylorubrum extorquens]